MEYADALFYSGFLEPIPTSPCQIGHCRTRPDCSSDYYLVGITTQTLRANRVARLWGKPVGIMSGDRCGGEDRCGKMGSGQMWEYYLSDDHHPGRKIPLGDRPAVQDGEVIKIPGYLVPHKVQLYEHPRIMPCCL